MSLVIAPSWPSTSSHPQQKLPLPPRARATTTENSGNNTQQVPFQLGVVRQREQTENKLWGFHSLLSRQNVPPGSNVSGAVVGGREGGGEAGGPRGRAACCNPRAPEVQGREGSGCSLAAGAEDLILPLAAIHWTPAPCQAAGAGEESDPVPAHVGLPSSSSGTRCPRRVVGPRMQGGREEGEGGAAFLGEAALAALLCPQMLRP